MLPINFFFVTHKAVVHFAISARRQDVPRVGKPEEERKRSKLLLGVVAAEIV